MEKEDVIISGVHKNKVVLVKPQSKKVKDNLSSKEQTRTVVTQNNLKIEIEFKDDIHVGKNGVILKDKIKFNETFDELERVERQIYTDSYEIKDKFLYITEKNNLKRITEFDIEKNLKKTSKVKITFWEYVNIPKEATRTVYAINISKKEQKMILSPSAFYYKIVDDILHFTENGKTKKIKKFKIKENVVVELITGYFNGYSTENFKEESDHFVIKKFQGYIFMNKTVFKANPSLDTFLYMSPFVVKKSMLSEYNIQELPFKKDNEYYINKGPFENIRCLVLPSENYTIFLQNKLFKYIIDLEYFILKKYPEIKDIDNLKNFDENNYIFGNDPVVRSYYQTYNPIKPKEYIRMDDDFDLIIDFHVSQPFMVSNERCFRSVNFEMKVKRIIPLISVKVKDTKNFFKIYADELKSGNEENIFSDDKEEVVESDFVLDDEFVNNISENIEGIKINDDDDDEIISDYGEELPSEDGIEEALVGDEKIFEEGVSYKQKDNYTFERDENEKEFNNKINGFYSNYNSSIWGYLTKDLKKKITSYIYDLMELKEKEENLKLITFAVIKYLIPSLKISNSTLKALSTEEKDTFNFYYEYLYVPVKEKFHSFLKQNKINLTKNIDIEYYDNIYNNFKNTLDNDVKNNLDNFFITVVYLNKDKVKEESLKKIDKLYDNKKEKVSVLSNKFELNDYKKNYKNDNVDDYIEKIKTDRKKLICEKYNLENIGDKEALLLLNNMDKKENIKYMEFPKIKNDPTAKSKTWTVKPIYSFIDYLKEYQESPYVILNINEKDNLTLKELRNITDELKIDDKLLSTEQKDFNRKLMSAEFALYDKLTTVSSTLYDNYTKELIDDIDRLIENNTFNYIVDFVIKKLGKTEKEFKTENKDLLNYIENNIRLSIIDLNSMETINYFKDFITLYFVPYDLEKTSVSISFIQGIFSSFTKINFSTDHIVSILNYFNENNSSVIFEINKGFLMNFKYHIVYNFDKKLLKSKDLKKIEKDIVDYKKKIKDTDKYISKIDLFINKDLVNSLDSFFTEFTQTIDTYDLKLTYENKLYSLNKTNMFYEKNISFKEIDSVFVELKSEFSIKGEKYTFSPNKYGKYRLYFERDNLYYEVGLLLNGKFQNFFDPEEYEPVLLGLNKVLEYEDIYELKRYLNSYIKEKNITLSSVDFDIYMKEKYTINNNYIYGLRYSIPNMQDLMGNRFNSNYYQKMQGQLFNEITEVYNEYVKEFDAFYGNYEGMPENKRIKFPNSITLDDIINLSTSIHLMNHSDLVELLGYSRDEIVDTLVDIYKPSADEELVFKQKVRKIIEEGEAANNIDEYIRSIDSDGLPEELFSYIPGIVNILKKNIKKSNTNETFIIPNVPYPSSYTDITLKNKYILNRKKLIKKVIDIVDRYVAEGKIRKTPEKNYDYYFVGSKLTNVENETKKNDEPFIVEKQSKQKKNKIFLQPNNLNYIKYLGVDDKAGKEIDKFIEENIKYQENKKNINLLDMINEVYDKNKESIDELSYIQKRKILNLINYLLKEKLELKPKKSEIKEFNIKFMINVFNKTRDDIEFIFKDFFNSFVNSLNLDKELVRYFLFDMKTNKNIYDIGKFHSFLMEKIGHLHSDREFKNIFERYEQGLSFFIGIKDNIKEEDLFSILSEKQKIHFYLLKSDKKEEIVKFLNLVKDYGGNEITYDKLKKFYSIIDETLVTEEKELETHMDRKNYDIYEKGIHIKLFKEENKNIIKEKYTIISTAFTTDIPSNENNIQEFNETNLDEINIEEDEILKDLDTENADIKFESKMKDPDTEENDFTKDIRDYVIIYTQSEDLNSIKEQFPGYFYGYKLAEKLSLSLNSIFDKQNVEFCKFLIELYKITTNEQKKKITEILKT